MKKLLLASMLALGMSVGAQTNIANYTFAKTTGNIYTPITGGTKLFPTGTNTTYDEEVSSAITMGGTFNYGGVAITTCYISANGLITFGAAPAGSTYAYLSSALTGGTGVIAAFAQDGYSSLVAGATPEVRYEDTGTEFVVQYQDHANYYNRTQERLNFQIRLVYATGEVKIVYGNCTDPGTSTSGSTVQVGIRGNSTTYATNVNNLMIGNIPSGTTCDWSNAVTGYANSSNLLFTGGTNVDVKIPSGLQFSWMPGTQLPVRTFAATTAITNSGATLNWTAPAGATSYNVQYRVVGDCAWTDWTGNPVSTNSAALTGLMQNTIYQARVQASNGTSQSIYSHIPNVAGTGNGYVAAGSFTTLANCTSVVTATGSTPTTNSATINWTAPATLPAGYELYWSTTNTAPVGTTAAMATAPASASSAVISPLNANTTYYTWVRTDCNGTDKGVWVSVPSFTTPSLCATVTAPTANQTGVSTTPVITWNSISGATGYRLTVGTTSGGTDIVNNVDLGNVTSYDFGISGPTLLNSTMYFYSVVAYDGVNPPVTTCTVRNFTTACNPTTTLPVTENFDTTPTGSTTSTNAPACWRYAEPASWAGSGYVATTQPVSTPNNYHIVTGTATTGGGMLVSPQITPLMNGLNRVRLMAAAGGSGYTMEVGTLSNPSDVSTFTVIGSPISLTTTMTQYTVSIPSGANEYLAFRHAGGGTNRSIRLDDITIEPSPTCGNPTGVNVTSSTANGATIGWVAPTTTVGIGYDIFYSTSNTAPTASQVLDASNSVQAGPTDTTALITGLTTDMFYYVWVRAKCSAGDNSVWEGSARFYTSNYCTPTTANQNSWISEFTSTGAVTNMSYNSATATSASTFGYKNVMSTHKIAVAPSTTDIVIPISLTAGGPTVGIGIWADFDQDNTFSTGEVLYQTAGYVTSTSGATITVPGNTPVGNYRMRVLMNYSQQVPNDPCLNFTRGEIIDYMLQVDSALGTDEMVSNDVKVKVYPNPFTEILNISDVREVASVSITDMSGRIVKTIAKPTAQLSLGDLKSGMYLVTLKYKNGTVKSVKAIKK